MENNGNNLTALKLLFVDDSSDDVELAVADLRREGYQISYDLVDDPSSYLKALSVGFYDAILCDYRMPRFTSVEALQILRHSRKDIPFIIVSGVMGEEDAVKAMLEGAHDYIMKQNLKRLGAAIRREIRAAYIRVQKKKSDSNLIASEARYKEISEKLSDAMKAKDEFITIMSHELKTPLSALKLQTQMLLRAKSSNEPQRYALKVNEFAEQVDKHVNRLTTLVVDMLDIGMIRTGNYKFEFNVMNICDVIAEVLSRLRPVFHNYKVKPPEFICNSEAIVKMDKNRIEQVLNNLLTNALKYGLGKDIQIQVHVKDLEVETVILDQGIGIDPSQFERIFDRFERAISSNEVSGLGLGLYVSKEIIAYHEGRIWVESEIGKGTSFHFSIPRILIITD